MKKRVLKLYRWLLAAMGFATAATSCDNIQEIIDNNAVCLYGVPTMDYVVTGKVQNQAGEPVKGIELSPSENPYVTTKSAQDGTFSLSFQTFPDTSVTISVKDVDGPENGEYQDMEQSVQVTKVKEGDRSFYDGESEAKDVVVTLSPKTQK